MPQKGDEFFMRRALELASRAWGDTHPNPMVGAVIAKDGRIIAEGWHRRDGGAHAEINALKNLRESPQGAAIYVTLEPCSTRGRTGACTDAIIGSGISRVVIGARDPNPAHAGRAPGIFRAAGIECSEGVLARECADINMIFNFSIARKTAMLAVKYAQTSNGKIAERAGEPSRITEAEARAHVMKYRRLFPAVGVGFGTLVSDNPALTIRGQGPDQCRLRLVFDRSLSSASLDIRRFRLFSDPFSENTAVVCDASAPKDAVKKLEKKGVRVIRLPSAKESPGDFWKTLKKTLFDMRITGVIVEGGAKILTSAVSSGEADYAFEYTSPRIFPDSALDAFACKKPEIGGAEVEMLGADTCRRGFIINRPDAP